MELALKSAPEANDRASITVGETDTHWIDIIPMIYNHRVVLTPKDCTMVYDVGWCYPDMLAAMLAVIAWEQTGGEEPVGYLKRVGG